MVELKQPTAIAQTGARLNGSVNPRGVATTYHLSPICILFGMKTFLSDFLRGTIRKDDQQYLSLEEEIKHLYLYLEIEKVRFGHRLKTEIDYQEASKKMKLPSLLLQPLVENAIKFGLYDTIGEITIRLEATAAENFLHIRVENPFDPETSQTKPGTGFGLNSIQRRLYLLYGRNDLLATHQNSNTFTTELKIPQSA